MLVACPIPTCPSIIHGAGTDDSEGSLDQPMCFLDKLLGSSGCGNNSILTEGHGEPPGHFVLLFLCSETSFVGQVVPDGSRDAILWNQ